jgi:hypothetical protein
LVALYLLHNFRTKFSKKVDELVISEIFYWQCRKFFDISSMFESKRARMEFSRKFQQKSAETSKRPITIQNETLKPLLDWKILRKCKTKQTFRIMQWKNSLLLQKSNGFLGEKFFSIINFYLSVMDQYKRSIPGNLRKIVYCLFLQLMYCTFMHT